MSDQIQLDESLEALYHLWEGRERDLMSIEHCRTVLGPEVLSQLQASELILVKDRSVAFTENGLKHAALIIRRHRLAERLLADVLHMGPDEVERGACEFEHLVAEEVTEGLCTLLGHPKTCPHGSPIPEGNCCRNHARECVSAVVALWDVPIGIWSRIAYVCSVRDDRLHQLERMGVIPGARIKVHQVRPFVAVLDDGRIAMEESVARDILVWARPLPSPATGHVIDAE